MSPDRKAIDRVERYYDQDTHNEWARLDRHRTEFAVTLRALAEYLPPPPAQILDVGGGPGRYAIELTRQGYRVTLVDLSQASLERAAEQANLAGVHLAGIQQGNALDLSAFPDSTYDAVLLMGPLYHLLHAEERRQAVQEAGKVLKPGDVIVAAFCIRFALFRGCAKFDPKWYLDNKEHAERCSLRGYAARG